MLAELSLATLNMLTIVFCFVAAVFGIAAVAAAVCFGFTFEITSYTSAETKRAKEARRVPSLIIVVVSVVLMLGAITVAAWSGTEYSVRHDTNIPQRVNRSEVKIDSNAPTG